MKKVSKPDISPVDAYKECYSSFKSEEKKREFRSAETSIEEQSILYDQKAQLTSLCELKEHDKVTNNISDRDMIDLYNQNMVKNKQGRVIYDKLKSLPHLDKCPFCGVSIVTTLDHYLPKAKFPTFAVLPYNLVASCTDCNKIKSNKSPSSQSEQTLHPYYDDFTGEQWLFAEVIEEPFSVRFFVDTPTTWSKLKENRIKSHFVNYKLAERFSSNAASNLANLHYSLVNQPQLTTQSIREYLKGEAQSSEKIDKNRYETAMFQALFKSDWYCEEGYKKEL